MNTRRRFTEEEDRLILSSIGEGPSNLARVFRAIATEIGRDPKSIANRWYRYLSKKDTNHKTNAAFMTYSSNKVNTNRKVARENTQQPIEVRRSKWRRILDIIFE